MLVRRMHHLVMSTYSHASCSRCPVINSVDSSYSIRCISMLIFIVASLYWILLHAIVPLSVPWVQTKKRRGVATYAFLLSSTDSRYVDHVNKKKAPMMSKPPMIAPFEKIAPLKAQSAKATRKTVRLSQV